MACRQLFLLALVCVVARVSCVDSENSKVVINSAGIDYSIVASIEQHLNEITRKCGCNLSSSDLKLVDLGNKYGISFLDKRLKIKCDNQNNDSFHCQWTPSGSVDHICLSKSNYQIVPCY